MNPSFNCLSSFWYLLYLLCCGRLHKHHHHEEKVKEDIKKFELLSPKTINNDSLTRYSIYFLNRPTTESNKEQSVETQKPENVANDKEANLGENKKSVKLVENDSHSYSDSRSIELVKANIILEDKEDKSIDTFIPNFIDSEKPLINQYKYAETISNDGSSIPDDNSFISFLEDDSSFEDPNLLKLSLKQSEKPPNNHRIESISTPNILEPETCTTVKESIEKEQETSLSNQSLSSVNVEEIVDSLLNAIILSEIKNYKPCVVELKKEFPKVLTIVTASDYQSTPFIEENVDIISPVMEKVAYTFNVLQSEDLWELSDLTVEDPWKVESFDASQNDLSAQIASTIAVLDKKLLGEKISWLVPIRPELIDPLIESAIKYLHESRNNRSDTTEDTFLSAQTNLPPLYLNCDPVVTETEITSALFDSSVQQPYVDKRIIFQIVLEVFLEIYSFEKHLPQSSWNHSSFMVKNNVYSLWKSDTPPESYDLVRKIVREHVDFLINQKNQPLPDDRFPSRDESQSKIIRWCIRQQKDEVDKLLISDMRKEENEWIYYDEAEEEVKFQIAEEIFNILIVDTISWAKSISNPNLKTAESF